MIKEMKKYYSATRAVAVAMTVVIVAALVACVREPELHLYWMQDLELEFITTDLDLEVMWNYEDNYDYRKEWYYGWDDEDRRIFGELGYVDPTEFQLRRYNTGDKPYMAHESVLAHYLEGRRFTAQYAWGFWDLLVWNDISTLDGVQSLIFDETTTLDYVTASTNQTIYPSRYNAPNFVRSFWEPEALYSAYERAIEIDPSLKNFVYDDERGVWYMEIHMTLYPITYIYLTQVILHNNHGRIAAIDGQGNFSGMARNTNVNTGIAGPDAITIHYNTRLKNGCDMNGENVDIIGGRLMTFGLCDNNCGRLTHQNQVKEQNRHYMDVKMQFNNGMDSTLVFDITDQVRKRFKGGVITVELDVDTVPIPSRSGGSGFDAVIKDFDDGGTWEFDF